MLGTTPIGKENNDNVIDFIKRIDRKFVSFLIGIIVYIIWIMGIIYHNNFLQEIAVCGFIQIIILEITPRWLFETKWYYLLMSISLVNLFITHSYFHDGFVPLSIITALIITKHDRRKKRE